MPFCVRSLRAVACTAVLLFAVNVGGASAFVRATSSRDVVHRDKRHAHKRRVRHHRAAAHKRKRITEVERKQPQQVAAHVAANTTMSPAGVQGSWHLVLDSEFDSPSLDTKIWEPGWFGTTITPPVNTAEDNCYSSSNVTFPGDGTMHLNVTAQPSTCHGVTYPYTGALISSNPDSGGPNSGFQYTYGVVEARVYIPAGGTQIANWPAVWTDGQTWPNDGEDDIMEGLGGSACYHFHYLTPTGATAGPGQCDTNITPGWHTFASDWQPGSITYYYDGHNIGSITTGITSAPMYLVLNNTVSSESPNLAQADSMQVQYIRVWQQT